MDFIKICKEKQYVIYNVKDKMPILALEGKKPLIGWSKITYEQALKFHDNESQNWGLRTGLQENGDYLLGLDFDMWYKDKGKYIESQNTRKLSEEFSNLNSDNIGLFSSSTELNRGCIVNIKNSNKILKILQINGSSKICKKDYCLEILNGFNMVLPPTKTKCKVNNKYINSRTFLGEEFILNIEEDSELEEFIFNYLNDCTKKDVINKTDLRKKKTQEAYDKYIKNEFKFTEDKEDIEIFKMFLDIINIDRVKNYNEWYKIGYGIKKTFGPTNGWELFQHFCKRDIEGFTEEVKETFYSWDCDKYPYTQNYILNCAKLDNKDKFLELFVLYSVILENKLNKLKVDKFEENVKKILEPSIWIKKNRKTKDWEYCTQADILHTYSDIEPFNKSFVMSYMIGLLKKTTYDFVDFVPTKDEIQNVNGLKTFNMFKGFKIDKLIKKNEEKPFLKQDNKFIEIFKKHIHYMTDGDKLAEEMLIQYICRLLFVPKERPGICIVLQGKEGAGKTTLFELLQKMIGLDYCFHAEQCERDVLDRFNGLIKNKILININEPDFNSFRGGFEKFKSFITDSTLTIEEKNMPQIRVSNYLWFFITTNNEVLFRLSQTDRRFYFIKTSKELTNNYQHFDQFYDYLNNEPSFIFSIYKYLETRYNKHYNFRYNQKENRTQFHKLLVDNSKDSFLSFIQEFIEDEDTLDDCGYLQENSNDIVISPKDLNSLYKKYCRDEAINCFETGKSIKRKLLNIDPKCHKKIENKSKYKFNKNNIIEYLKNNKLYEE